MKTKTTYTEQRSLIPLGETAMIARLKAEPSMSGVGGKTRCQLMKYFILLLNFICFTQTVIGQYKHDYIWMLGIEVDSTYSYFGTSKFDFNNGMLKTTKQNEGLHMFATNASICDDDGNLLFYSNGCKINNANDQLMENGDGLNPGGAYSTGNCPDLGNSATKGMVILPPYSNGNKYYLIHAAYVLGQASPFAYYIGKLYYSVVDMAANNGLGKVIQKNVPIISDTLYTDLHAVRHANNEDWWIIVSRNHTNTFYKVLFSTSLGQFTTDTQAIGPNNDPWASGGGQAVFSPDGTKYARFDYANQVSLFDFDRGTGGLSNYQNLIADTLKQWSGLSFSPNSRFLYVSTLYNLYQFDLMASDIQASRMLIDTWDGYYDELCGLPVNMFLMQLGPDCKIYMVGLQGTRFLHVINKPDELGLACDFRQHGLQIPTFNTASIPNFPNYRLGTGYPVCDSNIVYTASGFTLPPVQGVNLYPNPASGELNLEFSTGTGKPVVFRLYDTTGRLASYWTLEGDGQPQSLNISGLASGLYLWQLNTVDGLPLDKGKLVIEK